MRAPELRWLVLLLGGLACSSRQEPVVRPNIDPGRVVPPLVVPPPPPPPPAEPVLPPAEAFQRGLMPLVSTNVWAFRQNHPEADGRGVLIGILDSGIDAAVPGLTTTSTGQPKLLDLRDFSGEGRVALEPITVAGDSTVIAGQTLRGVSRLAAVANGPYYGGALRELPLGDLPASDVNGDGDNADQLPIVVGRASDGWVLFADTDGDGSLANEKPIHDYLVARETFGWTTGGRPSPLAVAANFGPGSGPPTLDLFFDTSGHGTHVAGIAAASKLYGVDGFDGVAPGAQLLGLKIANNALGGISVTGSMVRAIDYAIKFAAERNLPLVLNMSFGVGNEREGTARIDAIIDSVLAAHPDVVFTTSAGNDGPGLSTLGFPGTADRVISVGATIPPAFIGAASVSGDVIAFFSSRGGEVAKPDILAPGIAYSSVPRWDTGSEDKNGTSMAAPHVAGAVALIVGALERDRVSWTAAQIKQAMLASARSMGPLPRVDQGAGLLDVIAAERLVRRLPAIAAVRVKVGGIPGGGVFRIASPGRAADTTIAVEVEGSLGGPVRLTSSAAWLNAPGGAQLTPPKTTFAITVRGSSVSGSGILTGTITGWATDTTIGPLFRIPVTLINPFPVPDSGLIVRSTLTAGAAQRVFFAADSGRPFAVDVDANRGQAVLAFLHEPGGQPFRTDNGRPAGFGEQAARYDVDGREVVPGYYEAVAVASPQAGATIQITVTKSPVTLDGSRAKKDTVVATIRNPTGAPVSGTAMLGLVGAERGVAFSQRGSAERRVPVRIPPWARRMVVDLQLARSLWPLFTDLGLSVLDADGRILENDPLNYAFGRVEVEIDSAQAGQEAVVLIAPGFADPDSDRLWDANLAIRFYAETPVLVETPMRTEFTLAPGADVSFRWPLTTIPWSLGDGFFPLGQLVAEVAGGTWGRELRLHEPLPPAMR